MWYWWWWYCIKWLFNYCYYIPELDLRKYENDHWRRRWWEERRPSPGASKSSSSAPRTRRWTSTYVITTTRMLMTFRKKRSKLQFDSFIPCSERIVRAVTDMVLLFPEVSSIFFQSKSKEPTTHVPISGAGPFCGICKPLLSHRGSNSLRDWVQDAHSEVPTCPRADHDDVDVGNHRDFWIFKVWFAPLISIISGRQMDGSRWCLSPMIQWWWWWWWSCLFLIDILPGLKRSLLIRTL